MDITNLNVLKSLLSRFHIRPSEKLAQNFLVSRPALEEILAAADLKPEDIVLEIGAGVGTLTLSLAEHADRVFAIEKDARLTPPLRSLLRKNPKVQIINQDFLKVNVPELLARNLTSPAGFKVVANIPYYITGKILTALLALRQKPVSIILLVQKEVGERICARAGDMSVLALSVRYYGRPELLETVPASAFFPKPKVDSVILKITPFSEPALASDPKRFFRLVKIGFASRRKTLENNLAAGLRVAKAAAAESIARTELSPAVRAQELSLSDWKKLYDVVNEKS